MCFSSSRNSCPTVFLRIQCDANEQVNKNSVPKPKCGTHAFSQPKEDLGPFWGGLQKTNQNFSESHRGDFESRIPKDCKYFCISEVGYFKILKARSALHTDSGLCLVVAAS